jgi:hypothetical protein
MLYLRDKEFSYQLQLLVKLRVKEVYPFYVFSTTTITCCNSNWVYASLAIFIQNMCHK